MAGISSFRQKHLRQKYEYNNFIHRRNEYSHNLKTLISSGEIKTLHGQNMARFYQNKINNLNKLII